MLRHSPKKPGFLVEIALGNDKVPPVSSRLSAAQWEQMKTAYASGLGLRELARNAGNSAGTVLARAKREG